MATTSTSSSLSQAQIVDFLRATPPFNDLDQASLDDLAGRCAQESHAPGAVILVRGRSQVDVLRLIVKGRVKVFFRDEEGQENLLDHRGPGMSIGALGILRGSLSNLDVVSVEQTLCLVLTREDFLDLIARHPRFSQHYLKLLSESYVGKVLAELSRPRPPQPAEGSLFLFSAQVGDVVRRRPVTIPAWESVQRAAMLMSDQRAGCLLVTDSAEAIVGIITDRDLRTKVVAAGRPITIPVGEIMSSPVQTIPIHTVCFDAMLEMMKRRVHHIAMEKGGRIVGVFAAHDLMVVQGSSPLYLVREIAAQNRIEGLYELSLKSPRVVRALIYEGAKPGYVTRMITLINDYILDRMLTLLQEELGPPPVPFCWIMMGSEGRKEQTFRTDQDNGLIYQDPQGEAEAKAAREYFALLGSQAIEHLVRCGFPRCKGGIMASNPQWCQPLSVWRQYFDRWISTPEPQDVLHATIFFDFRPGYGHLDLGTSLRDHLLRQVSGQEVFFRHLAKDTYAAGSPLTSILRNFAVEREGPHKDKLDLKTKGLVPFVDFARLMSLRAGVRETNTLERYQRLVDGGHLSTDLHLKASQAFEFQMQLRLVHQQMMHEEGLEPDNYINPAQLSELERRTLKEALGVISEIKSYLRETFRLGSA